MAPEALNASPFATPGAAIRGPLAYPDSPRGSRSPSRNPGDKVYQGADPKPLPLAHPRLENANR